MWRPFLLLLLAAVTAALAPTDARASLPPGVRARPVASGPLVGPESRLGPEQGAFNGSSLIRVPAWVQNPRGKYYLYFAPAGAARLRLAFADQLEGPWTAAPEDAVRLGTAAVPEAALAAPEVVIDERSRRIWLFHHPRRGSPGAPPLTQAAESTDGLTFSPRRVAVGPADLRVFFHDARWFALSPDGGLGVAEELGRPFVRLGRVLSEDLVSLIEPLATAATDPSPPRPDGNGSRLTLRHLAVDVFEGWLIVYFSCAGDRPERIFATAIELAGPPAEWKSRWVLELLRPEMPRVAPGRNEARPIAPPGLRDPAIYREGPDRWLVYASAAEPSLRLAVIEYLVPE